MYMQLHKIASYVLVLHIKTATLWKHINCTSTAKSAETGQPKNTFAANVTQSSLVQM